MNETIREIRNSNKYDNEDVKKETIDIIIVSKKQMIIQLKQLDSSIDVNSIE